ncbi:molybdopterin molybdotransferase MoeA [Williamwhitmania taraxaci]|uniref:Molybdopterin molybdenumtransferase n=1 Tax=Williamwhitmania taraxaci TaxID=1640674 RepID=A0A1G6KD85_9BACT|nr:gephyrin-like molybdotransferase Glp [Williamwhitmania taraxaci]SDC28276.1 molybdopterin molybdotransferase [Williamwhitmania taraxaci]
MITFDSAFDIVLSYVKPLTAEVVDLYSALGRVLAEPIVSDMDMPPFDKSAVDGYACRKSDMANLLEVLEVIAAGQVPTKNIGENQCTKIMTGAMLPVGADCVLMVEDTEQVGCKHIKYKSTSVKNNICLLGEDVREKDVVITPGVVIQPQHIAVFAALGYAQVKVFRKPVVAILSTGDELVEPSQKPGVGQIRNSNGHQLVAQVIRAGGIPNYMGIVEDTERATFDAIKKALESSDILLLTGGVSMGDFDFVPSVLIRCGVELLFDSVAVQPGKPTTFGKTDQGKLVFGLPGNPVSSFTQFELLVRPAMHSMMGGLAKLSVEKRTLAVDYHRKRTDRLAFIPIVLTESGEVNLAEYHGSAHIFSLPNAHGIMAVPLGVSDLKKGDKVDVRSI